MLLLFLALQTGGLQRMLEPLRPAAPPVSRPSAETRAQVAALVAEGFPAFDRDGDGRLGEREFGAWMATLRPDPPAGGSAEAGWTRRAFEGADLDGSGALSPAEVERFIGEAAAWRLPTGP